MLIAEIGLNHQGDILKAKQLIAEAHLSGADIVKSQAVPKGFSNSMPKEFYEQCMFSIPEMIELIYYARSIGTDLFYSIFHSDYNCLNYHQKWHKHSASQSRIGIPENIDSETMIISIPSDVPPKMLSRAKVLFVNDYLAEETDLYMIDEYRYYYHDRVGFSDHSIGPEVSLIAVKEFNVQYLEKHFILDRDKEKIKYNGKLFRDSIHSCTPKELSQIARGMK